MVQGNISVNSACAIVDQSYTCTHQRLLCLCGSELRDELANIYTDTTRTTLLVAWTYFGQSY